jgi:hypothetical protein
MVEILWRVQRWQVIFVFVDPTLLTLVSLLFSFVLSGFACAEAPPVISYGCYIDIAGAETYNKEQVW